MNRAHAATRPLSRDDVLTVTDAARELQADRKEVRAWLHRSGVMRQVLGQERVIWGDVLDALRERPRSGVRAVQARREPRQTDRFG
jgi:hypothetical protein